MSVSEDKKEGRGMTSHWGKHLNHVNISDMKHALWHIRVMKYYVRAEKMSYRYVQQHGQISTVGIQEARGRYPEYGCMDINVRD